MTLSVYGMTVPIFTRMLTNLLAIMDNIRNHITLFSLQALTHPGRFEEVLREHAAILEALKQRDRRKAVQAMAHHLATTEGYWLRADGKE